MSYETGLGLAFLLWLYGTVATLIAINSQFERNLNKIGQRLSWITLTPKPLTASDQSRGAIKSVFRFLILALIGLASVLLSWLYVAWFLGSMIYMKSKDSGAPQAIKEYRWKLRNMDLSLDQLIRESMKVAGQEESAFEQVKADLLQMMRDEGLRV